MGTPVVFLFTFSYAHFPFILTLLKVVEALISRRFHRDFFWSLLLVWVPYSPTFTITVRAGHANAHPILLVHCVATYPIIRTTQPSEQWLPLLFQICG
jgi:hypothetical protein